MLALLLPPPGSWQEVRISPPDPRIIQEPELGNNALRLLGEGAFCLFANHPLQRRMKGGVREPSLSPRGHRSVGSSPPAGDARIFWVKLAPSALRTCLCSPTGVRGSLCDSRLPPEGSSRPPLLLALLLLLLPAPFPPRAPHRSLPASPPRRPLTAAAFLVFPPSGKIFSFPSPCPFPSRSGVFLPPSRAAAAPLPGRRRQRSRRPQVPGDRGVPRGVPGRSWALLPGRGHPPGVGIPRADGGGSGIRSENSPVM